MKLIVRTAVFLIVTAFVGTVFAQSDLPAESKRLVDRLKAYEAKEKKSYERLVRKKRKEVIVALNKQLAQYTRNAKLDAAVAIKKEIERLEGLNRAGFPDQLVPKRIILRKNGRVFKPNPIPAYHAVDGDQDKGQVTLEFEHENLEDILTEAKEVFLVFKNPDAVAAETKDTIIVKSGTKIIGRKKGAARNQKVTIKLDVWKVQRIGDTLPITIECIGSDGFFVTIKSGSDGPMIFLGE